MKYSLRHDRIIFVSLHAAVMELADVVDSKSSGSDIVPVRIRPAAPFVLVDCCITWFKYLVVQLFLCPCWIYLDLFYATLDIFPICFIKRGCCILIAPDIISLLYSTRELYLFSIQLFHHIYKYILKFICSIYIYLFIYFITNIKYLFQIL